MRKSKIFLYPSLLTIVLFTFYGYVQWLDVMITSLFYWMTILIYEKVFLLNRRYLNSAIKKYLLHVGLLMGYSLFRTVFFKSSDLNSNLVWILELFNIDANSFVQWILCILLIQEPCSLMIQTILKSMNPFIKQI